MPACYRRTRRDVLIGLAASSLVPVAFAAAAENAFAAIEARSSGRLGVFAIDTGSSRSLARRADERFLMCSTAKLASVAALLERVDAGAERLDRLVTFTAADLAPVGYAPDTTAHLGEGGTGAGGMTLEALCAAAIEHSDNGAANLILAALGGPAAVTRFVREAGDAVTRFDRTEPTLNHASGDEDTTTPRAYAGLTRALLLGPALAFASRTQLDGWMGACTTGLKRLRAGVPADWRVGDKTGTVGPYANDVAVLRPPGQAPIVVAAYLDAPAQTDEGREAVLRAVGAAIAAELGKPT